MTEARKRRIWTAHHGKCICGEPVPVTGPGVIYDHHETLWMGGAEHDGNVRPLCAICNLIKTAFDATKRAKTKRQQQMAPGAPRAPSALRSRGFQKTLRKRMNGKVEPR